MKRIGEVRRELYEEIGLDISEERIRRYEDEGILKPKRDKDSNFRLYTDDDVNKLKKVVAYAEIGIPIQAIANSDTEVIMKRVMQIRHLLAMV